MRSDKNAPTTTRRQNCALTSARTLGYGMEYRRFITALLPTYGNSNANRNVALLAEMLQTLVAGLLVLQDEAAPLGLQINWTKTKIQHVGEPRLTVDSPGGQGRIKILWCP